MIQVTLGPRGRNVLLEKDYGPPLIVNDGVTIARNIELPNRAHNAGAKLVQEVASTSDEWAGDGTSSTTILTAEIAKKVRDSQLSFASRRPNAVVAVVTPVYTSVRLILFVGSGIRKQGP